MAGLTTFPKYTPRIPGEPDQLIGSVPVTKTSGPVEVINATIPNGERWVLTWAKVTVNLEGRYTVKVDGALKGFGRTGAGESSDPFSWVDGPVKVTENQIVILEFSPKNGIFPDRIIDGAIQYVQQNA